MPNDTPDIDRALVELDKLYARVAAATELLSCSSCGRCCHFDEVDHILYCSDLEATFLRLKSDCQPVEREGRCPHQHDSNCHAREGRPLGCRIYFCNLSPEDKTELEEIAETAHRDLKEIHSTYGLPWNYAPFLSRLS